MDYASEIARAALDVPTVKIQPDNHFVLVSGMKSPMYNDNRKFLFYPQHRALIADGFVDLIFRENISYDVIAGVATAGISPATTLADRLGFPLVYINKTTKFHGLKNRIEGLGDEKDFFGKRVLVIEDLITTGGSSISAIKVVRDANGIVEHCLSIFNYCLAEAEDNFSSLNPSCRFHSISNYNILLEVACEIGALTPEQFKLMQEWKVSPKANF